MHDEPYKILLVEVPGADADLSDTSLQESLPGGFSLTRVASLTEAMQRLEKAHFDLALLDLSLSDRQGLDTIVSACEQMAGVPIVVLAGTEDSALGLEAIQAGAQDYLIQGRLTDDLFVRALHYAIARHSLQREARESHAQLSCANRRMAEMFMGIPIACYTYDSEGCIKEWNRASEMLYGLEGWQVIDRPITETIARPEDADAVKEMVRCVFAGQTWAGVECTQVRCDGAAILTECSTFPLRDAEGTIVAAVCANLDVTLRNIAQAQISDQMEMIEAHILEINEKNALLEYQKVEMEAVNTTLIALATTDGLTQLKNHRAFQNGLDQEFHRASRYSLPLSLLLIDVDSFKQYNDTYGHPEGDAVLQQLATILKDTSRETDLVARYGGEEFAVVLPNTDAAGALVVAERFRTALEAEPWSKRPVTASFGVASFGAQTADGTQLIVEADAALYASKQRGRNRTTHFNSLAERSAV